MAWRNGSRAGPPDVEAVSRDAHGAEVVAVREGAHVVEMQRRRLLGALVELVCEYEARSLSVAMICERARLSRRTFYELFDDREACVLAAFEEEIERATRVVGQTVAGGGVRPRKAEGWRERVRVGLVALLSFFDQDPGAARLLVVEALSAGELTLKARQRVRARLVEIVDEGREQTRQGREPPPLTAEGVVGAVSSVIHARILEGEQRQLTDLVGALMAMIVQPYLGAAAAQRELDRSVQLAREPVAVQRFHSDPFKDLPMRLTYRTVRVLCSIAEMPGSSNKQVARASGIVDEGQTSKLLRRLHGYGLIDDAGAGPAKGMARAWSLTERGAGVLQAVGQG